MPVLNIGGTRVRVGDEFLQMSPEDQQRTVDEIASSIQPKPKVTGKHLSFEEGQAMLDAEAPSGRIGAALGGFVDGVPLLGPALDEIGQRGGAALGALSSGRSYEDTLNQTRLTRKALSEVNPKTELAGRVAGSILPMIALGSTSVGARLLGNTGSLATKAAFGAGSGAVLGGADTAVRGGSGTDVATSAALGGFLGGAMPVAMAGVGRAYGAVKDAINNRQLAAAAGTTPEVLSMLKTTLEADGTLGPAGRANMASAGPDAMLADAGPNARSLLDTAFQRGGAGVQKARQAIDQRVARASRDLGQTLDINLGRPGESMSRDLVVFGDKSSPLNKLYKRAYETPIDYSQQQAMEIEQLVKSRVPPAAIKAANDLMRVEGVSSKQILAKIGDDGSVVFERLPDVRQLDYITRGLRQVAEEANGKGALGGTTPVGRAYGNLATEIRGRLKDLVPEYKTALDMAGTEIGKVKAYDFGETLLRDGVTRNEAREFLTNIPNAERMKAIEGVRQSIDDKLANVKKALTDGNVDAREAIAGIKLLTTRANREKLVFLIGRRRAEDVFREIDRVSTTFELRASLADNSKTYARQAVAGKIDQMTEPGVFGKAAQGEPIGAGRRVVQQLTGMTPDKIQARKDRVWAQLAEFMTRSPDRSRDAFNAMEQMGIQQGLTRREAQTLAARALAVSSRLTYPANALLTGQGQGQPNTR